MYVEARGYGLDVSGLGREAPPDNFRYPKGVL